MKFEDYKDNEIVKSLLDLGFSQEYIEKAVDAGDIKVDDEDDEEKHGNSNLKKGCGKKVEKSEDEEEDKSEEEVEKSEDEEEEKESKNEDLKKSFISMNETLEFLAKSVATLTEKVEALGKQTPSFKSEGLNNIQAIEKSFRKDENNKIEMNIISQRAVVSKAISNALESAPEDIAKSLQDDALAYLTNPEADTVGEDLARYMYQKGIKFVK